MSSSSKGSSPIDSEKDEIPAKKAKTTIADRSQKKNKTPKKGVVNSSDGDSNGDGDEVQSTKKTAKAKASSGESDNDETPKTSAANANSSSKYEKDANGNEMIPIGDKRFVTVDRFKGRRLISIREFYQKDDKWLPGKKGISLTDGQYQAFKKAIPEIEMKMKSS